MRILMTNLYPLTGSGSGVYTVNMARALIRQGHEVCIIFTDNIKIDESEFDFKCHPIYFTDMDGNKPEVEGEVVPFNFPCNTTHPRSLNQYKKLTEQEEQIYCQAWRDAIAQEIKEFKPDVIHAGHIFISAAIASEFDVPLIITCHGTDIQTHVETERFHKYSNTAADSCKAIICISQKNLDEVKQCFVQNSHKAKLMPNGYDSHVFYQQELDRTNVLSQFGINKPYKKLVSFAGKFAHFKGIDILIKAAKIYEDQDTATVLAGDGQLFDEMNKLAKNLGLKNIYFIHNQPHDKLRELYNVADVSCAPSRNEPFGLVVIEANACGAPVIGTNDGGIAGILTDKTGILINPESPEELANAIKSVLNGEKNFDRKACAHYTEQTYSQDKLILNTIELYKSAII